MNKPKTGERVDVWFSSPGDWAVGMVTQSSGAQFHCEVPGVGQVGPFHHARDRFRLWRPKTHPAQAVSVVQQQQQQQAAPALPMAAPISAG